jgi:hypothetical protein
MHHSLMDSSIPLTTPAPARLTDSPCHRQRAPLGSSLAAVSVRRALAPSRHRALAPSRPRAAPSLSTASARAQ